MVNLLCRIGVLECWSTGPRLPSFHHSITPFPHCPSSPRLERNLAPALLANDFQRIDAIEHFLRNRQSLRERFPERFGAVEAGLGCQIALWRAGIERRSGYTRKRHQASVRLKARRQGQKHFPLVENIDVFIEHEGMLEPDVRS